MLAEMIVDEIRARLGRMQDHGDVFLATTARAIAVETLAAEAAGRTFTRADFERIAATVSSKCLAVILCVDKPASKGALRDLAERTAKEAIHGC